jgi:hypothetical protein
MTPALDKYTFQCSCGHNDVTRLRLPEEVLAQPEEEPCDTHTTAAKGSEDTPSTPVIAPADGLSTATAASATLKWPDMSESDSTGGLRSSANRPPDCLHDAWDNCYAGAWIL